MEMRNCLYEYADKCQSGSFEVYSIRHPQTGKRKACLGFNFNDEDEAYTFDAKGFANTPLSGEMQRIEQVLLAQLNDLGESENPVFGELVKLAKSLTSERLNFQRVPA